MSWFNTLKLYKKAEFKQTLHNKFSSRILNRNDSKIDSDESKILTYSCKDLIFELLCLHKWKFKYKSWERHRSRRQLFLQHADSFKSEIDWLSIISSIRELQELKQQVREAMEQNQLMLEAYQRSWYFDTSAQIESNFNSRFHQRFSSFKDSEDQNNCEFDLDKDI